MALIVPNLVHVGLEHLYWCIWKNGFCGGGVFKGGVKQVVRTIIYFKDTGMGVPPNYHNCSATSL